MSVDLQTLQTTRAMTPAELQAITSIGSLANGSATQFLQKIGGNIVQGTPSGSGSSSSGLSSITTAASMTATVLNNVIYISADGVTITLPNPTTVVKDFYWVIKCLVVPTAVSVVPISSTIDGSTSFVFATQNEAIVITNQGSNYKII